MNLKPAGMLMLAVLTGCSPRCPKISGTAGNGEQQLDNSPDAGDFADDDEDPVLSDNSDELAQKLALLRKGGKSNVPWIPPSNAEEHVFYDWVKSVAALAFDDAQLSGSIPDGFLLEEIPGNNRLWLISEPLDRRRGAGAFVLRRGPAKPLIVEAPHTFFDQGTLPIAIDLFEQQGCRALLINTVHRYSVEFRTKGKNATADDDEDNTRRASPSDVAHAEDSYFQSAHRALTSARAGMVTIQLHGFNDKNTPNVAVIVSGAGSSADPRLMVEAIRKAFPDASVREYPKEIRKLGGESNVQAVWSSRRGEPFFHIEMSRTFRDQLTANSDHRRRFVEALAAAVPDTRPNP